VDGYNILPVVVEDTNYLMRRERNSRKYNQSLRLQLANEYDTINITASDYPIPGPDPCEYLTTFAKSGGNSQLNVGANFGDACNIIVTNATRGRWIQVSVSEGGESPIAGQTYYVQIDYTTTIPFGQGATGYIDLGNVATGGGTRTYFSMNSAGTPIIASGVWGTGNAGANYFFLHLPQWLGGGSFSGNIYVTVGFGNCP
jgi:hypothetical protein